MVLKEDVIKNDFSKVETLHAKFLEKGGKEVVPLVHKNEDGSDDDDEDEEEGSDEDEDEEMGDAEPKKEKEKQEPVIDEDGFELVQKRRR